MGHVQKRSYRRADGTLRVYWQGRSDGPDGRQHTKSFDRERDAKAWVARRDAAALDGTWTSGDRLTVGAWLDHWLDNVVRVQVATGVLAPRTAAGYESHVRVHLQPAIGGAQLRTLTVAQVDRLLADLQMGGLSAATAQRVRATLMTALTAAQREELVNRNVARLARPPRVQQRRPSVFTPAELERIGKELEVARFGALYLFAMLTGLRASELRGLRWEHVDLTEGWYEVHAGVHLITKASARVVPKTGLVESAPKTDRSGERVPLSAAAVTVLVDHARRQQVERAACPVAWPKERWVFTTHIGTRLSPANVERDWRALLERAGVPRVSGDGRPRGLHELRRTFATRLRSAGVPLEDVQRLGRWSSPQVLLRSYAASDDARLRAAADTAATGLGDNPGTNAGGRDGR